MREHPILFSGPMVRAILDGRKTQTRRVVKPCGTRIGDDIHDPKCKPTDFEAIKRFCPYGKPTDHLWVRENARLRSTGPGTRFDLVYQADSFIGDFRGGFTPYSLAKSWVPSIHMPRWASRITLEVESIRVERLRDISEADAKAEGVEPKTDAHIAAALAKDTPHRMEFWALWQSINAKRGFGWDVNPWVWVLTFKRISLRQREVTTKSE